MTPSEEPVGVPTVDAIATRLRTMVEADIDEVARLETAVQPVPWSASLFAAELGLCDRWYVVARTPDGALAGFGGIWLSLEDAHITTVAVDPALRRRGVGRTIVARLLDEAVVMGATAATLEVRRSNTAAIALYRHFGFAPVGVRPGYYPARPAGPGIGPNRREDALIMWKHDLVGLRSIEGVA